MTHEVGAAEVVRELVEAVVRLDEQTALSLCTPDVHIHIDGFDEFEGHEDLAHLLRFQAEVLSDASVRIHHVLVDGDTAAVERTEQFTISGERVTLAVGSFFHLRGGLVAEWYDYHDLRDVARALGH